MTLNIKIENFEGPFDLLLHLIKKNEMDIYDIKIYDITAQYLQYVKEMEEMDLEITSEFVVIAATLIEIKSKMLIPKSKNDETAADIDDPRKELVDKLLEYKKFKMASEFFRARESIAGTTFGKKPEIIDDKELHSDSNDFFINITMLQLYNIFNNLMSNYNKKMNKETVIQRQISIDQFKIEDMMVKIKEAILDIQKLNFADVIKGCESKIEVVVTFLAVLELIKQRNVRVYQEYNFSDIYLEGIEENEENKH